MEIELPWWRHQMETFSALLALCAGNTPGPVNSPHKSQWRGALMFSLICTRINDWVYNREAGDLRRHYDVIVMTLPPRTGPPYVTVGFPSHITSNVESVSMSWRHQIWRHQISLPATGRTIPDAWQHWTDFCIPAESIGRWNTYKYLIS